MTRSTIARLACVPLLLLCAQRLAAQALYSSVAEGRSARSHAFDVLHIAAKVRFHEPERAVIGIVTHTMRSLDPALRTIRLDAGANMTLERVAVNDGPAVYRHYGDTLDIDLGAPIAYNDTFTVTINYRVVPKSGLYFVAPDSTAPTKRRQIWTQGEDEDTRYWLPCYDYPNDRATSELWITVPGDWKALSNGKLLETSFGSDGAQTWHYLQDKPHASYLIMLAAGDYLVTRDTVDNVPLEYWTYPEMPDRVQPTFGRTPDVIRYFARQLGVRYPWSKYAQIFIADFMYGGMENTSATTLNDYALVDERGLLDYNTDGLVAHEAAHQWFGDLVTNRSWGHLWLHESYATFLAARYRGYRYGEDVLAKEMLDNGRSGLKSDDDNGRDPIALGKGFTNNIYDRGSRVLYMLSRIVGEENFWRASRLFLERHALGLVETNDLKLAFEDATGRNLDWFFSEWIYRAGAPAYRVEKTFERDTLRLRVRQTQAQDSLTGLFRMPVPLEFHMRDRVIDTTVWIGEADQTFTFALGQQPRFVVFDAGDAILKRVDFPRSDDELAAQLAAPRMVDRLLAVEALGAHPDDAAAEVRARASAIADAFAREGSPFVREVIVEKIAGMTPAVAAPVIERALRDTSADVRKSAADRAYVIADRKRRASLLRPLLEDRSYNVMSSALGMLATTDTAGLGDALARIKGTRSRRDRLATAWLNAVVAGRFITLANDVADYASTMYREETRSLAYQALAKLKQMSPAIRGALLHGLMGPESAVRTSAAAAVRALMDPELRAAIEKARDAATGEQREFLARMLE